MPVSTFTLWRARWKVITLSTLLFGLLSFGATFLFPLEYRADAQVLIIPQSRPGVDLYTVLKSAERVGDTFVEIMQTDDFLAKVRLHDTAGNLKWTDFDSLSDRKKRIAWPKMAEAQVLYGTGLMNVSAYNTDPAQARLLASGVVTTLVSNASDYIGTDFTVKAVNNPVVTPWPVRPNLLINTLLGFVAGFIVAVFGISRKKLRI